MARSSATRWGKDPFARASWSMATPGNADKRLVLAQPHHDRVFFAGTRHQAALAGFSDEELYEELPRPLDQRRIPMIPLLPDEGGGPFAAWTEKGDRVPY